MKKTLILALALLLAIFCFTACDSDDDDEPSVVSISTNEELATALKNGGIYVLQNDVEFSESDSSKVNGSGRVVLNKEISIDLNGKALTSKNGFFLTKNFTVKNGTMLMDNAASGAVGMYVRKDTALTLDNVKYTSKNSGLAIDWKGSGHSEEEVTGAVINVKNPEVTGVDYGISTNVNADKTSGTINVENSKITAMADGGCGFLFNITGVKVTIKNSTITGDRQGMFCRGGEHELTDSTFIAMASGNDGSDAASKLDYTKSTQKWGQGTYAPHAALLIGNNASSYQYKTSVTLDGITVDYNFPKQLDYTA